MRQAARPSLSNQARVITETLALAQRENFHVNVIEAFDQPWKRALEGATGRYWGIFDRASQAPKFSFDGIVSDHPHWPEQAAAGIAVVVLAFAGAWLCGRGKSTTSFLWSRVAAITVLPAVLFGWTLETIPVDSIGIGGWVRMLAFAAVVATAPIVCAIACAKGRPRPAFATLLGRPAECGDGLDIALGVIFIALTLLSIETALGLVFDPRYRDIPFAPQSGAVFAYLGLMLSTPRAAGFRPAAETLAAAVLAVCAIYIAINETVANWQALWLSFGLIALAAILMRTRAAPG
jgi:hypothetical protein